MRSRAALILDFDGVICDSIDECLLSSWIAYHSLFLHAQPLSVPSSLRSDFAALRPFVRGGEDYLLIHHALASRLAITDQPSFDALAKDAGEERLGLFRELFYQARRSIMDTQKDFWLSLNKIYPHMRELFGSAAHDSDFPWGRLRILSTKRPEFIAEIIESSGFPMPRDRIIFSGNRAKLSLVERLIEDDGLESAVFIDDQIDHLIGNTNPRIEVYLASWGYVKQEWLSGQVPVLSPRGFAKMAREWRSAG